MEVETTAPVIDPAAVAAPSPAPASPAPEAVAPVQADQAPTVAAPVAEAASPAPVADAEPKPADAAPVPEKSLLDKFDEKNAPPVEAKPEDKPADAPIEEPKPEVAPAEEPKPVVEEPPVVEALPPIDWFAEEGGLKVPEVIALDEANRGKLTEALETFRADPNKGAQALIDMHAEALDQFATSMHTKMWSDFNDTRKGWTERVMADPELGGNGHDTAMGRSARMRDMFVSRHAEGTKEFERDQADWKEFMQVTGAGDHPALHRMLNNIARRFDEASPPPANPKPPADLGKKPGSGKRLSYTHPTSQPDS